MKYWKYSFTVFMLSLSGMAFATCEQAQNLYEKVKAQPQLASITQISQTLQSCPQHIGLSVIQGDLYSEQGNVSFAISAYENALQYQSVKNDDATEIVILFRLFSAQLWKKDRFEASYILNKIHQYKKQGVYFSAAQEKLLKQADQSLTQNLLQQGLTSAELKNIFTYSKRDLSLEPPTLNYRLHFDVNSSIPTSESRAQLQQIAQAMLIPDVTKIEIIGHTDSMGSSEYNQQLSFKRAQAVKNLLIQYNEKLTHKLSIQGKGKSELLYTGKTEEDHRLNRRVEFIFKK